MIGYLICANLVCQKEKLNSVQKRSQSDRTLEAMRYKLCIFVLIGFTTVQYMSTKQLNLYIKSSLFQPVNIGSPSASYQGGGAQEAKLHTVVALTTII